MKKSILYLGLLITSLSFAEEEFHLSAYQNLLNELPIELRTVTETVNPKIQTVVKADEFYGSYNGRTNVLTFNKFVVQDQKKFKRTLFHELAHVYDQHRKFLSNDPVFQTAFGARIDSYNKLHLENLIPKRSPDEYEFENTRELFAVNFEYFMLDTDYKCRRPYQYNYLKKLFNNFDPSKNTVCAKEYPFIKMELGVAELTHIDLKRLYRIDYLLASPAKHDVAGGFGHAMLRLAICSPERNSASEDCLKDLEHHLVVTFRASVDDEQISSVKGLKGSYPSNLYVMSYKSVIEEYTKIQYRDLTAFPLNLSVEQKNSLLMQMSLQHWSLERKYYFVTNNCASEIVNLFRSSIGLDDMFSEAPYRPLQLESWFRNSRLLQDRNPEIVKSAMDYWQKSLDILSPRKKIKFSKFLKFSFEERVQFYHSALSETPSAKTRALIRLLEFKIYSRLQQMYATGLEKVLREEQTYNPSTLRELLGFRNSGWILKHGYGIPTESEQVEAADYLREREGKIQEQLTSIQGQYDSLKNSANEELRNLDEKMNESRSYLNHAP